MLITFLLAGSAFLSSIVSGVLGMAGGVALVGVMAALLAAPLVVPLHGMVQLFSNGSRAVLLWRDVAWREAGAFIVAQLMGVACAAFFARGLVFVWLEPVIGVVLIAFVAWRRLAARLHPERVALWIYPLVGFCVGAASLFVGATGPMAALVFRRDDWTPKRAIATMAIAQAAVHVSKLPAFLALGFDYRPYLPLLLLLFVCAAAGTWVGRRVLDLIPKARFAVLFDVVLLGLGVFLVWP